MCGCKHFINPQKDKEREKSHQERALSMCNQTLKILQENCLLVQKVCITLLENLRTVIKKIKG